MKITVNHVDNLVDIFGGITDALKREMGRAVKESTLNLQAALRIETGKVGLGQNLINAWRAKTYPGENSVKSAEPAGYVYSNARLIIYALSYGSYITAKKKTWLAIPLPVAGASVPQRDSSGKFVKYRMSPQIWEQEHNMDLQFVSVHGGAYALLVAVARLKKGRKTFGPKFRTAGAITHRQFSAFAQYGGHVTVVPQKRTRTGASARKGLTTVPVFILVRSVKDPKLFDLEKRADEAQGGLAGGVAAGLVVAFVPKAGKV